MKYIFDSVIIEARGDFEGHRYTQKALLTLLGEGEVEKLEITIRIPRGYEDPNVVAAFAACNKKRLVEIPDFDFSEKEPVAEKKDTRDGYWHGRGKAAEAVIEAMRTKDLRSASGSLAADADYMKAMHEWAKWFCE